MMSSLQIKVRYAILSKVLNQNFKFYLEFCKLYEANNTLNAHLTSLLKEKNSLKNEIQKHEVIY